MGTCDGCPWFFWGLVSLHGKVWWVSLIVPTWKGFTLAFLRVLDWFLSPVHRRNRLLVLMNLPSGQSQPGHAPRSGEPVIWGEHVLSAGFDKGMYENQCLEYISKCMSLTYSW